VISSFLAIAAVTLFALISAERLVQLVEASQRSQAFQLELSSFESDLKGIESGTRGYVITGDEAYLRPSRVGAAQLDKRLTKLRGLNNKRADRDALFKRLSLLSRARLTEARQIEEARRAGRIASKADFDRGKAIMDKIRGAVSNIKLDEERRFNRVRNAVNKQQRSASFSLLAGVLFSLAFLAASFIIQLREVKRRRAAEADLKSLSSDLERRVEERTDQVLQSESLFRAVFEGMPDMVYLQDTSVEGDPRFAMVNKATEAFLGKPRSEIVGATVSDVFQTDEAKKFLIEDREALASHHSGTLFERTVDTPNGVRIVESRKFPILFGANGHRFLLGLARDVTEQRAVEDQLRQMQRIDAVGQLTGGIAHDFNNLLSIIIGNAELLREQIADGTDAAAMGDDVLEAAARGADLVRRLLAFARQQQLTPQRVDLDERLPNIVTLLRRVIREDIDIKVTTDENLWPALIDPSQVDDALVNLAINARDAMPDGGVITIETANVVLDDEYSSRNTEVTPGKYVMLAVSDTGTGMNSETLFRAFEPFFTTKEVGLGTGLGLSQVYGWAKQSGGHVKIYSELGHGTTVRLYLPRAPDTSAGTEPIPTSRDIELPKGHEKILVVEDNTKVRSVVTRRLHGLGYQTIEASTGEAALDLVRNGLDFDLMFTDVIMPGGMTGHELASEVLKLRPRAKILFTSGYTQLAVNRTEKGTDAHRTISKPHRKEDLARAIRDVLDRSDGS